MACIKVEDFGKLHGLPKDHPRWRHVDECPRCRSQLASYERFMKAEVVPGANVADAEQRLGAWIHQQFGATATAPAKAAKPGLFDLLRGLLLRPAFGIAVVTIAAISVFVWQSSQDKPMVLRGTEGIMAELPLEPFPVEVSGTAVELKWRGHGEAETYEVRFFGEDLSELGRSPQLTDTTWTLDPEELTHGLQRGTTVVWRVVALQNGDELDVSPPSSFEMP